MPKPRFVQIYKGDQEAEVVASSVPAWERNGWTVVDDESSEVQPLEVVLDVDDDDDEELESTDDPQPALSDENKE